MCDSGPCAQYCHVTNLGLTRLLRSSSSKLPGFRLKRGCTMASDQQGEYSARMKHQVRYGKRPAEAKPAAGVRGVVCKSAVDERYFFRVYTDDHTFVDYELRHDDLTVTIAADELASFYRVGDRYILDHGPGVLGLEHDPAGNEPAPDIPRDNLPRSRWP